MVCSAYPLFLRELKSTIADAALNTCVLGHVCMLAGYPLFELAFDFQKWFHQFFYAHGEAWLMGGLVPTRSGPSGALRDELLAILNHVMAMGWRFASGIAQRAANLIVCEALRRFDILEEGFRASEHPAARRWLEQRFRLPHDCYGKQDRFADMLMFTDDPRVIVAGSPAEASGGPAARPIRFMRVFFDLVGPDGINFLLSKHSKWSCGAWTSWIGARFCGMLGLIWVEPAKALRALQDIAAFAASTLPAADLIPLLGFLEHLAPIIAVPPYLMPAMYASLNEHRAQALSDADRVRPVKRSRIAARLWRVTLANFPGCSLMRAVQRDALPRVCAREWVLRGDACFDAVRAADGTVAAGDGDPPGMGGHFFGCMWTRVFTVAELQVWTIPVAEFCAAVCNLMVQLNLHPYLFDVAERVVLEVDALATPTALSSRARSIGLVGAHEEFMELPQFKKLTRPRPRLDSRHLFGAGNKLGDFASRSRKVAAEQLARQLGL